MTFNNPIKLKDIAKFLNSEFSGNPEAEIKGLNEIHRVVEGDITFVDHPKYYKKALDSNATFIIINKKVDCPAGKGLIFSDNPFDSYISIIQKYHPFISAKQSINTKKIGKGTIIQPNVFIGNNVEIGENCIIHPNVSIYDNSIIGNNVIIHSNTVIGADAFYFKKTGEKYNKMLSCGRVVIHDNVEIGSCCTIDKGVSSDTVIGEGTKMDNHIQIGHDTIIGKNCLFASHVGIAGVVNVEDNVILWGQVGVQKDLTIGKGVIVLGQSGISKSLEAGKTYFGSPAREAIAKMREIALINKLPEILTNL